MHHECGVVSVGPRKTLQSGLDLDHRDDGSHASCVPAK